MNGDACRRSFSISDGVRVLPLAVMTSYLPPDLLRRVLAEDRDRPGVADHPLALLRAVGGVDRHHDCPGRGAGELDLHPLRAVPARMQTRSPGWIPRPTSPPAIFSTTEPSSG
jgi:hypothetical protein